MAPARCGLLARTGQAMRLAMAFEPARCPADADPPRVRQKVEI